MTAPSGNAKHQAAVTTAAEKLELLRADVHAELTALRQVHQLLLELLDTRQSVGLGFQTPEVKASANAQAKADRLAARTPGTVPAIGQSPAPVTITAVSASAQILFAVRHHIRRLAPPAVAAAAAAVPAGRGRRPLEVPTTDADIPTMLDHLEVIVDALTSSKLLRELLRDLEHQHRLAADVVDGPARTNHPQPCPWCGRTTLVIHHRAPGRDTAFIRCEGTHPCECDWSFCDCHRNPTRNRHEWTNSGRAAHTWRDLANLQTKRQELIVMETKALDAIERVKALHQPAIWVPDDGTDPFQLYFHATAAELVEFGIDHTCTETAVGPFEDDDPRLNKDICEVVEGQIWHAVAICGTCGDAGSAGDLHYAEPWPCATLRALELDQPTNDAGSPAGAPTQ